MPARNFRIWPAVLALIAGASPVAVAQVSLPDAVEAQPLSKDAFSTGTLDQANGALPAILWRDSDAQTLEFLLANMPARLSAPSLGDAMRRTLLSSGEAPQGAAPSLGGKKLVALTRAGFLEDAREIASLSIARRGEPWTEQAGAVAALLSGDVANACRRGSGLSSGKDALFWVRLRVLCYAEAGERDAADLTLGILRDQGALDAADAGFLTAAATGVAPLAAPPVVDAVQFAIARKLDMPLTPDMLSAAEGGVLVAVAGDSMADIATRIDAAERAVAMGVLDPGMLAGLFQSAALDVAQVGNAHEAALASPDDPATDAALYLSVLAMSAPEFLRDKAQRIARALGLAKSFYRAYALSALYADEIAALEGALLTPDEAAVFALARMAMGDSVGAAQWLMDMIGSNDGVSALPEAQSETFVELVTLLAVLDPQSAAQVARAGGVKLVGGVAAIAPAARAHQNPATAARILETAFDAAFDGKTGQAGLAALAASAGAAPGSEVETVVISQSLRAAGLSDLRRRYEFERAWASRFQDQDAAPEPAAEDGAEPEEERGFWPRLKPRGDR